MTRFSRYSVVAALLVLLLTLAPMVAVFAQSGITVLVTAGAAHIRSGPGANTDSIGAVNAGVELTVTGRTINSTWWRVDSPFGQGWISNELVALRGDPALVPVVDIPEGTLEQPTIIVDRLPVTVYRNPNPDSFILGIAPTGMTLYVTAMTVDADWYQVETVLGTGYVDVDEVAFRGTISNVGLVTDPGPSFDGPTVQVNTETIVTTTPGGTDVLATLAPGTALPTGGRTADNTWWEVADVWGIGWIPVTNVSLAGSASNIPATVNTSFPGPAYTGRAFATVIVSVERKVAYGLDNYESAPYWDAFLGETLGVIARSPNGLWLKVTQHNSAHEAWVNFSGLTLEGSLMDVPVENTTIEIVNIAIVNTHWLNVRSGPDVKYQRVAALAGGETVTVIGRHPTLSWMLVEREDFGVGWINNEFVLFRGTWSAVPVVSEPIGSVELPVAIVDIPHNVYSQPDWNYPLGTIPGGMYTIAGRTEFTTWALIETQIGDVWISFEQIEIQGIASSAPVVQPAPVVG